MNYYRMKHSETEGVRKLRQCDGYFILTVTISYHIFEKLISAKSLSTSLHLQTHPHYGCSHCHCFVGFGGIDHPHCH